MSDYVIVEVDQKQCNSFIFHVGHCRFDGRTTRSHIAKQQLNSLTLITIGSSSRPAIGDSAVEVDTRRGVRLPRQGCRIFELVRTWTDFMKKHGGIHEEFLPKASSCPAKSEPVSCSTNMIEFSSSKKPNTALSPRIPPGTTPLTISSSYCVRVSRD